MIVRSPMGKGGDDRGGKRREESTEGEEEEGRCPPLHTDDGKRVVMVEDCTHTNKGGGGCSR